jgi:hypothetical protein
MQHNVLQYDVGGIFETRNYPPRQKLKRRRNNKCGSNHPEALYCVLNYIPYARDSLIKNTRFYPLYRNYSQQKFLK